MRAITSAIAIAMLAAAPLAAQSPGPADAPPEFLGLDLGFGVSGNASIGGGLYHARGIDGRRPTDNWRMTFGPTLNLPLGLTAGLDIMLSSEGSDFRQDINQFGISPTWGWGTLHLGDFSRDLTRLTVSGQRIRGAGLDLSPRPIDFSVQAGRVQRATVGLDGTTYDRGMLAARFGYGSRGSAYIELNVVKAKDDGSSLEDAGLLRDTLLLDTIPEGLRPEPAGAEGPQENLVAGLAGRLPVLDGALVIEGELAGALTTRDLTSPRVSVEAVGTPGFVDALHPLRLSTVGDYAVRLDADGRVADYRFSGGYERIGPGYSSAGLAYVINDREAYELGAGARFLGGRISVQTQYRHESNNLMGQRRSTTARDVLNASMTARLTDRVMASVTGLASDVVDDAPVDSGGMENYARSLNTNLSVQRTLFGRSTMLSLTYGLHRMHGRAAAPIPRTSVHNIGGSFQLTLSRRVSVAPSVSGVLRRAEGAESDRNLLFGFRGNARLLDGRLRTSANVSHTFSAGREIFSSTARLSYPVMTGATLSLVARHSEYSAFAERPSFAESFVNLTLNTSF